MDDAKIVKPEETHFYLRWLSEKALREVAEEDLAASVAREERLLAACRAVREAQHRSTGKDEALDLVDAALEAAEKSGRSDTEG